MTWLVALAGLLIIALLTWDVYSTVLVPRGFAGPVTSRLYRASWKLARRFSKGRAASVPRQPGVLGPLLVPMTYFVWATLLWVGFALVLYPWADQFIVGGNQDEPGRWVSTWYVSGYSVTTLGVGDLYPQSGAARLLLVVAAASGFVLVTVAVTYLLSVYGALSRTNALAYEVHQLVGRDEGDDPLSVVVRLARNQQSGANAIGNWLSSTTTSLAQVVQSQGQYPLLVYFQSPEDRSLPAALGDLLEIITVLRNLPSREAFPAVREDVLMLGVSRLARGYFESLRVHLQVEPSPPSDSSALEDARQASFTRAWLALLEAGVPLAPHEQAWAGYCEERTRWDGVYANLSELLGHSRRILPSG